MDKRGALRGLAMAAAIGLGAVGAASGAEPGAPADAAPAGVAPAAAPKISGSMILNLMNRPLDSPEAAFNKELKRDGGAPTARSDDYEVLSDGSVRYGRGAKSVVITIKNPCPPGDIEHEMAQLSPYRPLPGRGRR